MMNNQDSYKKRAFQTTGKRQLCRPLIVSRPRFVLVLAVFLSRPHIAAQPARQESNFFTERLQATLSFYIDPSVPAQFEQKLDSAMRNWAKHLNVNAKRCIECTDIIPIRFRFVAGDHGDRFPFQEGTHIVAHVVSTKFETNVPEVHFNAEAFLSGNENPDVYFVALHEIGHALGLSHSDNPNSIMYRFYQRTGDIIARELGSSVLEMRLAGFSSAASNVVVVPLFCKGNNTNTGTEP